MEMVSSVPLVQQAMMIMTMSLFSRSSVCFSVCLRKAPECTSEHLKSPEGSEWKTAGGPCSLYLTYCPPRQKKLGIALLSLASRCWQLLHSRLWGSGSACTAKKNCWFEPQSGFPNGWQAKEACNGYVLYILLIASDNHRGSFPDHLTT